MKLFGSTTSRYSNSNRVPLVEPTKEDKEERIVAIGRQPTSATQDEVTNVPWVRKVVGHHVRLVTVGGHHFIQDPLTCNAKSGRYLPNQVLGPLCI